MKVETPRLLFLWASILIAAPGLSTASDSSSDTTPDAAGEEDITAQVLPDSANRILSASMSPNCPAACTAYYAGASADSPFVAQVIPSGVGDLSASPPTLINCYPPYGVGPPYTEDWNVCFQGNGDIPAHKTPAAICQELQNEIGSTDEATLGDSGAVGSRSTQETTHGRWMKAQAEIGCGWGSTLSSIWPGENTASWSLEKWIDNIGFQIKRWEQSAGSEYDCCLYAMSFEGSAWTEGGSAVRFQFSQGSQMCRVDRETMARGKLDRSSGLALRDTETCGTGAMYWRHTTGGADAANLKGETLCQKNNNFLTLASNSGTTWGPVGVLPDHFTGNWGNELPNHACADWPYGQCKGVMGYNTIASPEECCQACVDLKWVSDLGGDISKKTVDGEEVYSNPCVAWQVVGGKCRIMREHMVTDHPSFAGKTVRQAIETAAAGGATCVPRAQGSSASIWDSERDCNYYSFARYRETFQVTPPSTPILGKNGTANATFSKATVFDLFESGAIDELLQNGNSTTIKVTVNVSSMTGTGTSARTSTITDGSFPDWLQSQLSMQDPSTCAKLRFFSGDDISEFGDGLVSLQDPNVAAWCETDTCAMSGSSLTLECDSAVLLQQTQNRRLQQAKTGRRLSAKPPKLVLTFDADGAGKDNMVFENVKITRKGPKKPSGSGNMPNADASNPSGANSSGNTSGNTTDTSTASTSTSAKVGVRLALPLPLVFMGMVAW